MAQAPWVRDVAMNITKHIRDVEDNVMRKRVLPALFKKKGSISYNNAGNNFDWRVRYSRAPLVGYADADTLTFARRNRHQVATQEYRGYAVGESATKLEQLKNRGQEAIVKLFANLVDNLVDDLTDAFAEEYYIDGSATGNAKNFHGLESFFGKASSGTGAGGKTKDPDDTYAGLSTKNGNYGGSWTGDWPDGKGDAQFDFWSPILIDSTAATVWGTTPSFAAYAIQQMRFGIVKTSRNRASVGKTDVIIMGDPEWQSFLALEETKERILTQRSMSNSILVALGFGDTMNFDGVDAIWEYGCPATTVYGLNIGSSELLSMQDRIFVADGPTYYQINKSYLIDVDILGNFRWNPRDHFKIFPYT
jgi:hypothetical protein